jgi:hypothetical protein
MIRLQFAYWTAVILVGAAGSSTISGVLIEGPWLVHRFLLIDSLIDPPIEGLADLN